MCFHRNYEIAAGENSVFGIETEFPGRFFRVVWIVHKTKVLPVELLTGARVEAEEVGVDGAG